MVKKYIVAMLFIISMLIPLFSSYETVRAATMNSKAFIKFQENTDHVDPINPTLTTQLVGKTKR
ncbi:MULTISPECIES: hypothetical protein [Bacillus cereus group]|uniref:hypothetical protein n=1 Tax=Bacillus cereus group TaxID=86661 RepID=UPI00065FDE6F|nr:MULTISPECIES: hypothetical protein [Bacillus cereus group]AWC27698.1 hypothetical protein CG483_004405 [Bacillus cytotoxicus]AWC31688.1 hypothetical protein CG482_004065 [Bacillus cytotoxicus]AWC35727.1 hypothetical protein CG481_004065 [Bacillus cytotoxicus]AWC40925.1 hypothetical protein CG480_010850 [Bacillus cytotoxicus]AWC48856.1 hypothetical protein CG478_010850 [Bacillus cytotoxicus]